MKKQQPLHDQAEREGLLHLEKASTVASRPPLGLSVASSDEAEGGQHISWAHFRLHPRGQRGGGWQ